MITLQITAYSAPFVQWKELIVGQMSIIPFNNDKNRQISNANLKFYQNKKQDFHGRFQKHECCNFCGTLNIP